jgi:hypothetical protein
MTGDTTGDTVTTKGDLEKRWARDENKGIGTHPGCLFTALEHANLTPTL